MSDINEAKRLIAASSVEGLRILGAGVSRPCYQGRYNRAAEIALSDPDARLTPEERRLIASFILDHVEPEKRDDTLQIRVSAGEVDRIRVSAEAAGLSVSEFVRMRALEE